MGEDTIEIQPTCTDLLASAFAVAPPEVGMLIIEVMKLTSKISSLSEDAKAKKVAFAHKVLEKTKAEVMASVSNKAEAELEELSAQIEKLHKGWEVKTGKGILAEAEKVMKEARASKNKGPCWAFAITQIAKGERPAINYLKFIQKQVKEGNAAPEDIKLVEDFIAQSQPAK